MTSAGAQARSCEVAIIGAGPAGSAAAAALAMHGRDVLVLEKRRFPRYRIGESLIPYCWFPLERIGMLDKLAASGCKVEKNSVQFVNTKGERAQPYYFFQHYDHPSARTWQVVRSEFDALLRANAEERGARMVDAAAKELLREDGAVVGLRAQDADGRPFDVRAKVVVDASGRETFAQSRQGWRVQDERLRKIAIWTYYRGALRDPGLDAGATTVAYLPEKGWVWYIPLPEDTVSVGVVAEPEYLYRDVRDPDAIFERETALQPWVREHLAPGEKLAPCRTTADFTYRSKHCAADGLVLAGDAFSFLDPVFSSGVFLALESGVLAADAIDAALAAGDLSAGRFDDYGRKLCQGIEAMRRLVHAFYDRTFSFGTFLRAHPDLRGDVTEVLIGNLYKDFDPLFAAMSESAAIPGPLTHGTPFRG